VPAFVIVPPPLMKTPNALPEIDAPALLVMLPPPSISRAATPVALIVPELVRVAAPPLERTPATLPEIDAPAALVRLPPPARSIPR